MSNEYQARNPASDQAAAEALAAGSKYGMVPIHEAMAGNMSDVTSVPQPTNRRPGVGVMKQQQEFVR
jgi:hypothetical protein